MVTIYTLIRRNLIVLEENSRYISFWTIFAFIDTLLISPMTMIHKSSVFSPKIIFYGHNLLW